MDSRKKGSHGKAAFEVEYENEQACAARFSVSVFYLRRLRYQNKIKAACLGGRLVRYPVAEVRAFFENATIVGAKGKCGAVHGKWAAKRAPRQQKLSAARDSI